MIDLHMHTHYSDGELNAEAIIDLALEKGMNAISITDHDTMEAVTYIRENNIDLKGLELINGIEFSVGVDVELESGETKEVEIHLLGYYLDINNKELMDFLTSLEDVRDIRNQELIDKINEVGLDLTFDEVRAMTSQKLVTKAHFAQAMIKKGYSTSNKDAFDVYLGVGRPAYIGKDLPNVKTVIDLIKNAGGYSVLAHPMVYKLSNEDTERLVKTLKELNVNGIECYYSSHTPEQRDFLLSLAKKYNLAITAGSDYHGSQRFEVLGHMNLGETINYSLLDEFRAFVNHK
ncbi:MAG: PHP domain-containing protein [bacterium]